MLIILRKYCPAPDLHYFYIKQAAPRHEKLLVQNAKTYLLSVDAKVHLNFGRLYIECEESACPAVEFTLSRLTGITGWAKAEVTEKNIEAIQKKVLELALVEKEKGAKTFKIEARRSDKSFPLDSYSIMREAGNLVYERQILSVKKFA